MNTLGRADVVHLLFVVDGKDPNSNANGFASSVNVLVYVWLIESFGKKSFCISHMCMAVHPYGA